MAGCFSPLHLTNLPHQFKRLSFTKKSKSLEDFPDEIQEDTTDMTLLPGNHKLPHKLGRLFRSKSEQGLKTEGGKVGSPSGSPKTDVKPRRRLLRVVRDDQSVGEEWENPHVVRRYTKDYWQNQMLEAQALQSTTSLPYTVNTEHTILKKTQSQSLDSDNEGNNGNTSPAIGKHACFKEQVQVIEFVDKEKISKHAHFMHETPLLESEEEQEEGAELKSVSDSCQSKHRGLRRESLEEYTKAKNSLEACSDESDSEIKNTGDNIVHSSDLSDSDEPKKKQKKKKKLHLHVAGWFSSGSSESKDSDSETSGNEGGKLQRVNRKLLGTHLQHEVDKPEL